MSAPSGSGEKSGYPARNAQQSAMTTSTATTARPKCGRDSSCRPRPPSETASSSRLRAAPLRPESSQTRQLLCRAGNARCCSIIADRRRTNESRSIGNIITPVKDVNCPAILLLAARRQASASLRAACGCARMAIESMNSACFSPPGLHWPRDVDDSS